MKFFSLAPKFGITKFNSNTISYRIRKSLVYMLSKMEERSKVQTTNVHFANNENQRRCPRFMIQVMTNGAFESGGLVVQTGKDSYLFNCGEETQRLASSCGIKLIKTYALFVTSHSWANIGGIMGVALTLQSLGVKKLLIYGPPPIKEVIAAWESFVLLKSLTVKVITDNPKLLFDDGCMKIQFVPLYESSVASTDKSTSDSLFYVEDKSKHSKKEISVSEARTTSEESNKYVQCFICKSPNFGQHINVQACLEKGLEIGPDLKILQNNKSVTLNNGRVIHLDEVSTSDGEYKTFIVVDCPSTNYLHSLINEKAFTAYHESDLKPADLVIHFTPPEVMNEPLYQEWMSKFPETTKHLVINSENSCADLISVHHVQTKLNYLCPEIFPLLNNRDLPLVRDEFSGKMGKATVDIFFCKDEQSENEIAENSKNSTIISGRRLFQSCPETFQDFNGINIIRPLPSLSLHYHPKSPFDCKHTLAYDPINCINEIKCLDNITEDLNDLADFTIKWKASDEYKNLSDYPKVLFLGTGSSMPSTYRSTSAILIYLNESNLVLLDCGEGTYQQLVRLFGKEKMPEFMEKLKMIYVSHHHADHHVGVINILTMRQKLLAQCKNSKLDDVLLLVPATISDWLRNNQKLYTSFLCNTRIVTNSNIGKDYNLLIEKFNKIGLSELSVCRVDHCRNSSGISITDHNNYKITYSGDCRPSSSLIDIGENSDLLIHEATFEDDLLIMAKQKFHSTISQAINMGIKMNAKYTILTHFSQRYACMPQITNGMPENVTIAFDNMKVSAKTLPILSKMFKFYKVVFADKIEKLNTKTLKRNLKKENDLEEATKIRITS